MEASFSMRRARVAGRFASSIQWRYCSRREGLRARKSAVIAAAARAFRTSAFTGGTVRLLYAARHFPFALASSTRASPEGSIRPSAISLSTVRRLAIDQTLCGLRGVNRSMK